MLWIMNTYIDKGDIPGLNTYLACSDEVNLEDELDEGSIKKSKEKNICIWHVGRWKCKYGFDTM